MGFKEDKINMNIDIDVLKMKKQEESERAIRLQKIFQTRFKNRGQGNIENNGIGMLSKREREFLFENGIISLIDYNREKKQAIKDPALYSAWVLFKDEIKHNLKIVTKAIDKY